MPNLETSESSSAFMDDGSILTSSSFKNHESVCDYSISVENVLLEDLDSYWDDLNARLTVSRMVSDSVIRGIVNAVEQDAADRNSSNEAELNRLAERLALYEPDAFAPKRSMSLPVQTESTAHIPSNCSGLVKNTVNRQHNLRIAAQRHLQLLKSGIQSIRSSSCKVMNSSSEYPVCWVDQRLKAAGDLKQMDKSIDALGLLLTTLSQQADELACTLKDTLLEQRWQWEFQREVDSTVFQAFIREQREELDMELCKQKSLFDAQSQFWFQKVQDLSILQQELDSISKHILSIEQEHPLSHGAQDYFEEMTSHKRKDQFPHKTYKDNITIDTSHIGINSFTEKTDIPSPQVAEVSLLEHMSKEELVSHYQNEINKIKRHLEASLHEKTEEMFKLKRELLKERGSLHSRRDKDVESLKKNVPAVVSKLDKVLDDLKNFSSVRNCHYHDKTCTFKNRIQSLLAEKRRLQGLLVNKRKEVDCLSSQVADAAKQLSNSSVVEENLLKKVKKLEWDIKDVKIETIVKDQIDKCIVGELIHEVECQMQELLLEDRMVEEFYGFVFRESIIDACSSMKLIMRDDEEKRTLMKTITLKEKDLNLEVEKVGKLKKEVISLTALINEKESALSLEVTKSKKLNQDIKLLCSLMEEENHLMSDINTKLEQRNKHLDLCHEELALLEDQASLQRKLISAEKRESNSLRAMLGEALNKIQQSDSKICMLNERLSLVSEKLNEADEQKGLLHDMVQRKESEVMSISAQVDEHIEQLESIVIFVQELSKSIQEFESIVTCNIERTSSRLEILCYQFGTLIKHADSFKQRELRYRKRLQRRMSDLEKAETEVDLLGDEVDALLNILEKIYIALDHYSPVLQHYPGVMEILKLVRRELKGSD